MSKKEKGFHSFKEFMEENKEKLEIQKLFNYYGLDVSLEAISDIEIIEKTKQLITYYNKKIMK